MILADAPRGRSEIEIVSRFKNLNIHLPFQRTVQKAITRKFTVLGTVLNGEMELYKLRKSKSSDIGIGTIFGY